MFNIPSRLSRTSRGASVVAATLVALALLAGSAPGASAKLVAGPAGGAASLPASIRSLYTNLTPGTPVGPSAWANFKSKAKPPWVIGYSSEYVGNNWRAAAMSRLMDTLLPEYKKAGLVKKVIVEQSNLNNELQIEQIKQMVNDGVNAIITCCSSTTVLNGAIAYAHERGVPFFVFNGYVTSPYAISEEGNYYQDGENMAKTLFHDMGGKGSFLNVIGFPGIASNDSVEAGMETVLKHYPHIHMAGSVTSLDTDSRAKEVVLQFLSTHPGKINGVFTQSPGEVGVLQAFLQAGRPVPAMTVGGESGTSCYWRQHPSWVSQGWNTWPPGDDFEAVWDMMVRTLEGQGPKVETLIHPTAPFSYKAASSAVSASCNTSGDVITQPPMSRYFSTSVMNSFFTHPANPLSYKP